MGSVIESVGIYRPKQVLDNELLERILAASGQETSDEWIRTRTGMTERRIAEEHETPGTMALEAARDAIERLERDIPPIEHILIATNSSDRMFPNNACLVREGLLKSNPNMIDSTTVGSDSYGGCGGINLAIMYADALINAGIFKTVLTVGSERLSGITDYSDRATCILFGDGASAYVQTKNKGPGGIMGHDTFGGGADREDIKCEDYVEKVTFAEAMNAVNEQRTPEVSLGKVLSLNGRGVYKYVNNILEEIFRGFEENERLNPERVPFEQLAAISPHLANFRMLTLIDKDYPGTLRKCRLNSNGDNPHFCNSSTASQGIRDQKFLEEAKPGDYLLKIGFGAGPLSSANSYKMPEF